MVRKSSGWRETQGIREDCGKVRGKSVGSGGVQGLASLAQDGVLGAVEMEEGDSHWC